MAEVVDDVVNVFRADGQADSRRRDVLVGQFLWTHLGVGGSVGMDDQTLHISYVGQQREDAERINELPGFFLTALNLEREDAAASVGEVFLVERMVGMVGQGGMVYFGHLRMVLQKVHYFQGVLYVTFYAQG